MGVGVGLGLGLGLGELTLTLALSTSIFSRAALNWMFASLGASPERSAAVYVMSLFEIERVITWLGLGLGLGPGLG